MFTIIKIWFVAIFYTKKAKIKLMADKTAELIHLIKQNYPEWSVMLNLQGNPIILEKKTRQVVGVLALKEYGYCVHLYHNVYFYHHALLFNLITTKYNVLDVEESSLEIAYHDESATILIGETAKVYLEKADKTKSKTKLSLVKDDKPDYLN